MSDHAGPSMNLTVLSEALADPEVDLTAEVEMLDAYTGRAVESYLGLSLTVHSATAPFHLMLFMAVEPAPTVRASLRFPVPGPVGEATAVAVTLFAGAPGAFVDLGADLAFMFGLDPEQIALDCHLDVPVVSGDQTNLPDLSTINQAVGVLLHRGDGDPDTAYANLVAVAHADSIGVAAAAVTVLASVDTRDVRSLPN